ncbi:MAG: general stress protein [Chitinophagaceae bacterium]|nr:MAG: general stress protein [Chitinophagaceae bacterium]
MGNTKNLSDSSAVEKIKELAADQVCLFCTVFDGGIVSRPMGTMSVDDDGSIWFMSRKGSEKNEQINQDDKVYLQYLDNGKSHYLSLTGSASIITDRKKIEELWSPMAKAWFEEGKDDPAISLIRVQPEEGHYWDTKNGKLVTMLKIAASAISGYKGDGGVEGQLNLS